MTTISVRPSLLVVWLRSTLNLTDTMVMGSTPNTLFGLIPIGRTDISQPINRISRVQVSTKLSAAALLGAAIFILLAISIFSGPLGQVIFGLFAIVAVATSYRTELVITDSGGGTQKVSVSPLDKEPVQSFARSVNERLAEPDR